MLTGLRRKAFDAARKKADAYAKQAGMELGPVIQITESDSWFPAAPQSPMAYGMAPAPVAAAPMPVSAGEQDVSLSVTVVYELRLPR